MKKKLLPWSCLILFAAILSTAESWSTPQLQAAALFPSHSLGAHDSLGSVRQHLLVDDCPRQKRRERQEQTSLSLSSLETVSECEAFMENYQKEQDAVLKRDGKIWILPAVVAVGAFSFFPATSHIFHSTIQAVSNGQYRGELSEEIRPLINGPVTLTISILFGSLVSMTISTLYQRQTELHKCGIASVNEQRHLQFLSEGLPEPQREQFKIFLKTYTIQYLRSFFRGDLFAVERRRQLDIAPAILLLSDIQDGNPFVMGEIYGSLNTMKQIWVDYVAASQKHFTIAHYVNLSLQAMTLLLIYLWETDDIDLLATHTFELRVAWAMLLSTMASLAAIIADLSTPLSNIIAMIRKYDVTMEEMLASGLAKDMATRKEDLANLMPLNLMETTNGSKK